MTSSKSGIDLLRWSEHHWKYSDDNLKICRWSVEV